MQNLSELTRRLIASQVEFVLVGGFAAAAHGVTLVTRDVDICCRFIRAKEAMNRDHDRITVHYLKEIKKQQSQN
jgi:hypothetical protein